MENLKLLRTQNKIKQEVIASTLNIPRSTYQSYEYGVAEPNIKTLIKIADYFDVSLDYLCGRQNKNLVFVDGLSVGQKKLIELIKRLTPDQTNIALGYFSEMLNLPYSEVRPANRPF